MARAGRGTARAEPPGPPAQDSHTPPLKIQKTFAPIGVEEFSNLDVWSNRTARSHRAVDAPFGSFLLIRPKSDPERKSGRRLLKVQGRRGRS